MKKILLTGTTLLSLTAGAQDSTNMSKLKTRNELLPPLVIDINYKRGNLTQNLSMVGNMLSGYDRRVNSYVGKPTVTLGHTEGGDLQVGYFFGQKHLFGVGTGIMYLKQTAEIHMDSFHVEYATSYFNSGNTAGLNGTYRQIVTSKAPITEKLSVTNINIPLLFKFKYQFAEHLGVAVDAGPTFNVVAENSISTNAIFDYEAAVLTTDGIRSVYDPKPGFDQADFLITKANFTEKNPGGNLSKYFIERAAEGYNVGLDVKAKPNATKTNYKFGNIGFLGQAALSYQLNYRVTLNVGGYYLVQNFKADGDPSAWMLTNKVGEYNSITKGVNKSSNTSYGLNVGLRYFMGKDKDIDYDGVPDRIDRCAVQKGRKTYNGCPDSDNDGIPDCDDECPFENGSSSANGCPDRDGDGIKDAEDLCQDLPGPKRFNGCPDSDNDGIPDNFDRCPNDAGSVTHSGCPEGVKLDSIGIPQQPKPADFFDIPPIELSSSMVNFETGKANLNKQTMAAIDEAIDTMAKYPNIVVFISGHTDDMGGTVENLLLSLSRAETVRKYMLSKNISKDRILMAGYGKQYPIADNNNAANRAKNRRIEMKLLLPVEGSKRKK